ncbi:MULTISPECIES: type II toxin-antitoxin system RelE/ParE family toxin [Pseudomonas]|jgi:plasmid stabilization system protein ParE|uniref:RelE/ParE family plasmid stabilization system protein n=1 Tax=Pseudomonas fluorescens TaxID=294 RepID=A0A0F4U218_PSEFL|nr:MULTISPECIES: type II toxin-antitoxin system RelE/ParE family toxin [Pseudomonas]KJZ50818.1 RelE/ParE family plasmid stabilization system protein [Pseudomonas fluorescens]
MNKFTVRFTEIAQQCIEDQIEYLAAFNGLQSAEKRVYSVIDDIGDKLLSAPYGYPVSPQLSELGVMQYRELNTEGYRVLYEIFEADQAIAVSLVLGGKQSVQDALVRYCLLSMYQPPA